MTVCLVTEINDQFLGFRGIEFEIILGTPSNEPANLSSVIHLVVIPDEYTDGCIVCKFDYQGYQGV